MNAAALDLGDRPFWIRSLHGGELARRSEGLFQVQLATQTVANLRRRLNRSANVARPTTALPGTLLTASWVR
jgi:hypothetical protein